MPDLSLLIVNHRSAALTAEAVRSARATSTCALQIVVVDNSEDDDELSAVRSLEVDEVIRSPRNAGYGAAINAGRASCMSPILAFSNPDIVFRPRCLDLLADAVREGAALAGPLFSWDEAGEWKLPLPEMPTLRTKAIEILSERLHSVGGWSDRRRISRRVRQWSAAKPMEVDALSGALLVTRAELFDRLGGLDERFFLFFEEIDLARRARAEGPLIYVPEAVCRHLYDQTAPDAGFVNERYLESERKFYEKWYGAAGRALIRFGRPAPHPEVQISNRWSIVLPTDSPGVMVEASPSPRFPSAAGHFPRSATVTIPAEIRERFRGDILYVRVIDPNGRVVYRVGLRKNG